MPGEHDLALPPWAAPLVPTFERVAHHLELAEGFMLLPVELPDVITADLLARWLTRRGLRCSLVDPDLHDTSPPLLEQLTNASNDVVATLLFVDKLTARLPGALQLLNQQRDVLAHRHPRPLLWSGPTRFLDLTWRSAPDLWSIASVPIRLAAPVTRPTATQALFNLLVAMYTPDELHRVIAVHFNGVSRWLSFHSATMAQLARELIGLFEREGRIDRAFFDILRSERPRHYAEITAVERLWSDSVHSARSARRNTRMIHFALLRELQALNRVVIVIDADLQPLHERIQEAVHELRATHRVRTVPLKAMDDEELSWSDTARFDPVHISAVPDGPPELLLLVDAEGRPLIAPDRAQMDEIRRLVREAGEAAMRGHKSLLVVPLASTREVAEITRQSLSPVLRGQATLPVHILDLDA